MDNEAENAKEPPEKAQKPVKAPPSVEVQLPDQAHDWLERLDAFEDEADFEKVWQGQSQLVWFKNLDADQLQAVLEANAAKLAEITGE